MTGVPVGFHAAAIADADAAAVVRVLLEVKHGLPDATQGQIAWLSTLLARAKAERDSAHATLYAAIGETAP